MDDIKMMIGELLTEIISMSPESINGLRKEWIQELRERKSQGCGIEEHLVNAICDFALVRALRKIEVTI